MEEKMSTYITGDCHGDYEHIARFCNKLHTTKKDLLIILGDVAANWDGSIHDKLRKSYLENLPITYLCVHGNHDSRPYKDKKVELHQFKHGKVWTNPEFPSIHFAKDGEIFNIDKKCTIVIGGAYSVDKPLRIKNGWTWHNDEQPDDKIKKYVEDQLYKVRWNVDIVLSHTVPYNYRPTDLFIKGLDQSTVDSSTEEWLQKIENKLTYKKWYAGHYHCERKIDKIEIMYNNFDEFARFV